MHFAIEVIIPPTDNIEESVRQVLARFDENNGDGYPGFWDWYEIGGRFSGSKLEAGCDQGRLEEFRAMLAEKKFTVSGLQWGKQELMPSSQEADVDALWRDWFPNSGISVCPFFKHANRALGGQFSSDVCRLADIPQDLTATRVVIAKHEHDGPGVEPEFMVQEDFWNGCNHVDTKWDRKVLSAVGEYREKIKSYNPEWVEKNEPKWDWLVVTVDIHS